MPTIDYFSRMLLNCFIVYANEKNIKVSFFTDDTDYGYKSIKGRGENPDESWHHIYLNILEESSKLFERMMLAYRASLDDEEVFDKRFQYVKFKSFFIDPSMTSVWFCWSVRIFDAFGKDPNLPVEDK